MFGHSSGVTSVEGFTSWFQSAEIPHIIGSLIRLIGNSHIDLLPRIQILRLSKAEKFCSLSYRIEKNVNAVGRAFWISLSLTCFLRKTNLKVQIPTAWELTCSMFYLRTSIACLHFGSLSCSRKELNLAVRYCQYSSSARGPVSSASLRIWADSART